MFIGIDIGGTFTDIVFLNEGQEPIKFVKIPTTPGRLETGVINGLQCLAEQTGLRFSQVARIVHGSTVATNALLEGKWARTALVTTAGFRDIIEIGRQNRPDIYDLLAERPQPIITRDLRLEVPERLNHQGEVLKPLNEKAVESIAKELIRKGVKSVAVSLLFSYANPKHERKIQQILSRNLSIPITLSSEVLPEFGEYERTLTTVVNAALRPSIGDYLEKLAREAKRLGFERNWQVMQSNGGITSSCGAEIQPVKIILSGPAAGVQGARFAARQAEFSNLITLDMGGTSCDVSLIKDGEITTTIEGKIAGYPIKASMVDIHTISAGGGSVTWIDKGEALRVGPRSAGANPGPVCYGKGGQEPTVTDAHLVLGRLNPQNPVGGLRELDVKSAKAAIQERIASPLGMSLEEAAQGILTVTNSSMERAIRVISVERGYDPRHFLLLPFGGAGPLHGASLAAKLEISSMLIPETAGILSALGLLQTDLAHDYVQAIVTETSKLNLKEINALYESFRAKGREEFLQEGVPEKMIRYQPSLDMRYRGQSFELNLGFHHYQLKPQTLNELVDRFHERHQQVYGHAAPEEPVELVNLRLRAIGLLERIEPQIHRGGSLEEARKPDRSVHFSKLGWVKTQIFARESLPHCASLEGPVIIEGRESTAVIPPQVRASIDKFGNLLVRLREV